MISEEEDSQRKNPEDENSVIEQEAGCDILLKKESIQLDSGDFESRRQLELLEGAGDGDDDEDGDEEGSDEDGDDDDDELDEGTASAIEIHSIMAGYFERDGKEEDDDDENPYSFGFEGYDNELLSSGKDVTIIDTTGDCNITGMVCTRNEYTSINAKRMEDIWDEIGRDVYGMMQKVELDEVVVNYNQHNFDMTGYMNGRMMSVVQHPIFTVIAPFD